MCESRCVFCSKLLAVLPVTVVSSKGLETIRSVSTKRQDGLTEKLKHVQKTVTVHTKCRRDYTKRLPKSENTPPVPSTPKKLKRKKSKEFSFKTCCLFCDAVLKAWESVSSVKRSPEFDTNLKDVARERGDEWGFKVLGRIELAANNLKGKKASYHRSCFTRFHDRTAPMPVSKRTPLASAKPKGQFAVTPASGTRRGRPSDPEKIEWFKAVCEHLENNADCQFSLKSLLDTFENSNTYGEKYLKRLLQEKYPTQLHFTTSHFTFNGTASKILNSEWYRKKKNNEQEERLRIVRTAAAIIREDVRAPVYNVNEYPSIASIAAGGAELVPATLRQFVDDVVKTGKRGKDSTGIDRKCVAICQNVIAATRPYSFISPLHISLAVDLEHRFGSRALIDILSSVGTCSSYAEEKRFESSVVTTSRPVVSEDCFVQFVMDNADFNVRSLTGHGTFHVMGVIMCVTPENGVQAETQISRKGVSSRASEREQHGTIPIRTYRRPAGVSGLATVTVRDLRPGAPQKLVARPFRNIDFLWLAGRTFAGENCPGWSGFMEVAAGENRPVDTTAVVPLPFINLQASNPSAIFTGLEFAAKVCEERGQRACIVTFDQPLFLKAIEIVLQSDPGSLLSMMIIRLGTFHLIMSFLLAIGNIMSGSGLEELLSTVYARNTVGHMLSGKAYSRAVRGHMLVQAALFSILMESDCSSLVKDNAVSEFNSLLAGTTDWSAATESVGAEALRLEVGDVLKKKSGNRTASLWLTYYDMVGILKTCIAAERLGDWELHLASVQSMLPYFHSAGCLNYARSAHLYLQHMEDLKHKMSTEDYSRFVTLSYFTVRHKNIVWSGNETDKTIEQNLMRVMKGTGGLTRGRGVADATLASWIHTAPTCAKVRGALEQFTGKFTSSSEQHKDLRERSKQHDKAHFLLFKAWLQSHNPFTQHSNDLVALASGVVADPSINCDKALEIGLLAMEKIVGKLFSEVKLSRKDRVRSLSAMTRSVRVGEDFVTPVNVNQLFHRMVVVLRNSDENDLKDTFSYELAPRPASLFDDNGLMRVGTKSTLVPAIESFCKSDSSMPADPQYVVDGGFLLRAVTWPRPATYGEIVNLYRNHVLSHYKNAVVVFDGYEAGPQTKDEAHLRRGCKRSQEIVFQATTLCTTPQADFLSNSKNKTRLIQQLTSLFKQDGLTVLQAEGDADTLIVQTALKLGVNSVIIGNDTDLLAILIGTSTPSSSAHILVPGTSNKPYRVHHSQKIIQALPNVAELVPFIHAITGCDTTSTIYRRSKKQALQKLMQSDSLRNTVRVFNNPKASKHDIAAAGEKFILALYGMEKLETLNEARLRLYRRYMAKQSVAQKFLIASLPPTSEAASLHSFRAYHQVQAWRGVTLQPEKWGWKSIGGFLRPVPSVREPAPERLLRIIYCNCRADCGNNCECKRHGLLCSEMCGHCTGIGCSNSQRLVADEDDDSQATKERDIDDPEEEEMSADVTEEPPGEEYDEDS